MIRGLLGMERRHVATPVNEGRRATDRMDERREVRLRAIKQEAQLAIIDEQVRAWSLRTGARWVPDPPKRQHL